MKKRIFLALFAVLLVGLTYPLAMKYSQSFKFVDEDEYMVNGWLLTKGKRLYQDISTNHQPVSYLISAGVHTISHPNNLFMLVQRHRQFVFLWSLAWIGLLVWRFGWPLLMPLLIFEAVKFWLLGNEFVAESMAAFPVLYIFASQWQVWWHKREVREELLLGICFVLAVLFSIPLVLPLGLLLLWRIGIHTNKQYTYRLILGGLLVCVVVFGLVPLRHYLLETIYYNGKYGIPVLSEFTGIQDVAKLFLIPIRSWRPPYDTLSLLYISMSVVWLGGLILFFIKRQWKNVKGLLIFFCLWGITNVRDIELHRYYYSGFHLLPWILVGLGITSLLAVDLLTHLSRRVRLTVMASLMIWLVWFWTQPQLPWKHLPDPQTENYVQYTPQYLVAEVINTVKQPGDMLMTIPNEVLPYFSTGLLPATRQVTYYEWQYRNPQLRQQWLSVLDNNPPRFISYMNDGATYTSMIQRVILEKYVKLFDAPLVYIRKDSLAVVSPSQQEAFLKLATLSSGINIDAFNTK